METAFHRNDTAILHILWRKFLVGFLVKFSSNRKEIMVPVCTVVVVRKYFFSASYYKAGKAKNIESLV